MNISDLKLYTFNGAALTISMTDCDLFLKFLLLIISIGYTIHKWYLLTKNNK